MDEEAIFRASVRIRHLFRDVRRINEAWSALESTEEIEKGNPDAAHWVRMKARQGLSYNEGVQLDYLIGRIIVEEEGSDAAGRG